MFIMMPESLRFSLSALIMGDLLLGWDKCVNKYDWLSETVRPVANQPQSLFQTKIDFLYPVYIKEWTGLQWNIALRKAENREEWRKLVVKSTVVPQRSARLRDR